MEQTIDRRPIRPCPFCFSTVVTAINNGYYVYVQCWDCLAEGSKLECKAFANDEDARDAVVMNWNATSIIVLGGG